LLVRADWWEVLSDKADGVEFNPSAGNLDKPNVHPGGTLYCLGGVVAREIVLESITTRALSAGIL
jgi:hypothetical protein